MFLGGRWTRDRPTAPGYYPVATLEGAVLPPERYKLIDKRGRQADAGHGEPGWLGWWWSHPLPAMQRGPGA